MPKGDEVRLTADVGDGACGTFLGQSGVFVGSPLGGVWASPWAAMISAERASSSDDGLRQPKLMSFDNATNEATRETARFRCERDSIEEGDRCRVPAVKLDGIHVLQSAAFDCEHGLKAWCWTRVPSSDALVPISA